MKPGMVVFDESGDTGTLDSRESYATAGLVCRSNTDLQHLQDLDRQIRHITRKRDYKYKHVARSTEARMAIADSLREPSEIYIVGHVSLEGGIAAEQMRAESAMEQTPVEAEDLTAPRSRKANLTFFTSCVASAVSSLANAEMQSLNVWWDRRSDMPLLESTFEDFCSVMARVEDRESGNRIIRNAGRANSRGIRVRFCGDCDAETRPASRVAGVIASDLLAVAHRETSRIQPHLLEDNKLRQVPGALEQFESIGAIAVTSFPEPFGKMSYASPQSPMFRAYAQKLASSMFVVMEPTGKIFRVGRSGGRWHILQSPD